MGFNDVIVQFINTPRRFKKITNQSIVFFFHFISTEEVRSVVEFLCVLVLLLLLLPVFCLVLEVADAVLRNSLRLDPTKG